MGMACLQPFHVWHSSCVSAHHKALFVCNAGRGLNTCLPFVGAGWAVRRSFVGEGEEQVLVRVVSLLIAIGGTLITALLLGIIR